MLHTLEVLAAHKAGVDIDVREGNAAELLEVEVKQVPVDGVQVGALARHFWGTKTTQISNVYLVLTCTFVQVI